MSVVSKTDLWILLDLQAKLRRFDYDRLPLKNLDKLRMEVNGLVDRTVKSDSRRIRCPECSEWIDLDDCVYCQVQNGIDAPTCKCGAKVVDPKYVVYDPKIHTQEDVIELLSIYKHRKRVT